METSIHYIRVLYSLKEVQPQKTRSNNNEKDEGARAWYGDPLAFTFNKRSYPLGGNLIGEMHVSEGAVYFITYINDLFEWGIIFTDWTLEVRRKGDVFYLNGPGLVMDYSRLDPSRRGDVLFKWAVKDPDNTHLIYNTLDASTVVRKITEESQPLDPSLAMIIQAALDDKSLRSSLLQGPLTNILQDDKIRNTLPRALLITLLHDEDLRERVDESDIQAAVEELLKGPLDDKFGDRDKFKDQSSLATSLHDYSANASKMEELLDELLSDQSDLRILPKELFATPLLTSINNMLDDLPRVPQSSLEVPSEGSADTVFTIGKIFNFLKEGEDKGKKLASQGLPFPDGFDDVETLEILGYPVSEDLKDAAKRVKNEAGKGASPEQRKEAINKAMARGESWVFTLFLPQKGYRPQVSTARILRNLRRSKKAWVKAGVGKDLASPQTSLDDSLSPSDFITDERLNELFKELTFSGLMY